MEAHLTMLSSLPSLGPRRYTDLDSSSYFPVRK
jgi:hypothetical protein